MPSILDLVHGETMVRRRVETKPTAVTFHEILVASKRDPYFMANEIHPYINMGGISSP